MSVVSISDLARKLERNLLRRPQTAAQLAARIGKHNGVTVTIKHLSRPIAVLKSEGRIRVQHGRPPSYSKSL